MLNRIKTYLKTSIYSQFVIWGLIVQQRGIRGSYGLLLSNVIYPFHPQLLLNSFLAEINGPFSEDTLERSPEIDELDGKPNYASRKRSSGMSSKVTRQLIFNSGLGE